MLENEQPVSVGKIKYFYGNYRGTVVDNYDPLVKGRVKLHIPGVYPEELAKTSSNLPWAEPAMDLFGGSWTNERSGDLNTETGVTTIPHTSKLTLQGAQVWVFFEHGNWMRPIFFAACQGGEGWHSEHNNQHVIKTDNVRVRIDERPGDSKSTCKFTSYNEKCNLLSKKQVIKDMPTRTDIEIWNEGGNAVNLIIKGNVNVKIEGDIYEEHVGNKHLTHIGNVYKQHDGSVFEVHNGEVLQEHIGKTSIKHTGDNDIIHTGDYTYFNPHGDYDFNMYDGKLTQSVSGDVECRYQGQYKLDVDGNMSVDCASSSTLKVAGIQTFKQSELKMFTDEDIIMNSVSGNIIVQAMGRGFYTSKGEDNPNKVRGGIIFNGNYLKRSGLGAPGGYWIYEYDPNQREYIDEIHGIEDYTGTTIQHNYGYNPNLEYDSGNTTGAT